MIFHLPGKLCSVRVSKADWPFSSWKLKPGFTPVMEKEGRTLPMPSMTVSE